MDKFMEVFIPVIIVSLYGLSIVHLIDGQYDQAALNITLGTGNLWFYLQDKRSGL